MPSDGDGQDRPLRTILVAYDDEEAADRALGRAAQLADSVRDSSSSASRPRSRCRLPSRRSSRRSARGKLRPAVEGLYASIFSTLDPRPHSLGDATEQVPGRELLAYGLGGRLRLVQVRRREEEELEVDPGPAQRASGRTGLPCRLRRSVPGRLRGRQTGTDPARKRLRRHRATECTSLSRALEDAPAAAGYAAPAAGRVDHESAMEKLERLRREREALAGSYADLKEGLERLKAREERRDPEARARDRRPPAPAYRTTSIWSASTSPRCSPCSWAPTSCSRRPTKRS
jgi:hypothetical protein